MASTLLLTRITAAVAALVPLAMAWDQVANQASDRVRSLANHPLVLILAVYGTAYAACTDAYASVVTACLVVAGGLVYLDSKAGDDG